jgi:hypothetical protein
VIIKLTSRKQACPRCHSGFIVVEDSEEDSGVCINCGYREPGSGTSLAWIAQSFAGWRSQKRVEPGVTATLLMDPVQEAGLERPDPLPAGGNQRRNMTTTNGKFTGVPAGRVGSKTHRSGRKAMGMETSATAGGRVTAAAESDQTALRQPGSLPGPGGS